MTLISSLFADILLYDFSSSAMHLHVCRFVADPDSRGWRASFRGDAASIVVQGYFLESTSFMLISDKALEATQVAIVPTSETTGERRSAIASSASDSISNAPHGFFSPSATTVQRRLPSGSSFITLV